MRFVYNGGNYLIAEGDKGAFDFGDLGPVESEGLVLRAIAKSLNDFGGDFIVTSMSGDGHLMDDLQEYIRPRSEKSPPPHIYLHNMYWAIRDLGSWWRSAGRVALGISFGVFSENETPDAERLLLANLVNKMNEDRKGDS